MECCYGVADVLLLLKRTVFMGASVRVDNISMFKYGLNWTLVGF